MTDSNYAIWDEILSEQSYDLQIVQMYLEKRIDFQSLDILYTDYEKMRVKASKRIISAILNTSLSEIIDLIRKDDIEAIESSEFPWFYSLEEVIFVETELLEDGPLTNEEIGVKSPTCRLKTKANTQRFGQAHSNLLTLLGLIEHVDKKNQLTTIGKEYNKLDIHDRLDIFIKLLFRIPLIRDIYRNGSDDINYVFELTEDKMKESSVKRRIICIRRLIDEIEKHRHIIEN